GIVVVLSSLQYPGWERLKQFIRKSLVLGIGLGLLFAIFGADMNERLAHVLEGNKAVHDTFHYWNGKRKEALAFVIGQSAPPSNALATDEAEDLGVLTPTDERPVPVKPSDVYVDVND